MSFEAMTWAIKQTTGNSNEKFVLLMLANYANEENECWPKVKTIAEKTQLSSDTVRRCYKGLAEQGLIQVEPRFHDGVQLPHRVCLRTGVSADSIEGVQPARGGTRPQRGGSTPTARGVYADSIPEPIIEPIIEPKKEKVCAVADATRTERKSPDRFEEFWQAFPAARRRGKGKTRAAFLKAKASADVIIAAVRAGRGIDPACPPMPLTWLNQGRWEDDPHLPHHITDGLPPWKAEKMRKAREFIDMCGGSVNGQ